MSLVTSIPARISVVKTASGCLFLRRAVPGDMEMLFHWRNLPAIVASGQLNKTVEWDEHRAWFSRLLGNPDHLLLIVVLDGVPIGQVRFDPHSPAASEVSIYLLPGHEGRGLGSEALRQSCWEAFATFAIAEIVAVIRDDNAPSLRAFRKVGFEEILYPTADGVRRFSLARPPQVPHNRITHGEAETKAALAAVQSGQWANGPRVTRFEERLAGHTQMRNAVCVSSGLSALRLSLLGLGVKPGDRVLIPAYCCVALANAVLSCGAEPVAVDVRSSDWILDPGETGECIRNTNPAAVIAVNLFGAPAPIEAIQTFGIPVIEDCAHGIRRTCSRADALILSFHATKLIGAGEGGAVLTDSDRIARFVRQWRDYSDQEPDGSRLNDKMTDLEAALAHCQLDRLSEFVAARAKLAERYAELLGAEAERFGVFRLPASGTRVWYRYTVEMLRGEAQTVISGLATYGITAANPVCNWLGARILEYPAAARAYRQIVSLPLYPTLTIAEQDRVAHAFCQVCRNL